MSSVVTIFDDLADEEDRLEDILADLERRQWKTASAADGWTIADVVLHLAQSEEGVLASLRGDDLRGGPGGGPGGGLAGADGKSVDQVMDEMVRAQRASPSAIFTRWRAARRAALSALLAADPQRQVSWVAGPVKPATLATTRLAEHWAHGLDITGPLEIDYPDTDRLRHVAWLAHRTLPYALGLAGVTPGPVRCELTAPSGPAGSSGEATWTYGPPAAATVIAGPAGDFCRVAERRLAAADSRLEATGPLAADALTVLRAYAA